MNSLDRTFAILNARGPKWPVVIVALVVILGGTALLVWLGGEVVERDWPTTYDPTVGQWFIDARTPLLTSLATAATFMGGLLCIGTLSVLVVIFFLVRRRWTAALTVGVTMALSGVVTLVVKNLVRRARPSIDVVLGTPDTQFSWPSGHTFNSTVFYGLLAGFVILWLRSRWARALVALGWLALVACVGLSRIYLGYHWLTDVIAGFVLGLVVLAMVALVHEFWIRRDSHLRNIEDDSPAGGKDLVHREGSR